MRDTTNEAIYLESIADLFAPLRTPAAHVDAASDFHADAQRHLAEARCWEKVPVYAYKGQALRDQATDNHLAATDTLRAAVGALVAEVAELRETVRALQADGAALIELAERRAS